MYPCPAMITVDIWDETCWRLYEWTWCALHTFVSRALCVRTQKKWEDLVFFYSCLSSWFSRRRTSRNGRKITCSVHYVILYFSVDWVLPDNGSNSVWGMNVSCRLLLDTQLASRTITLELHQPPSLILRMDSGLMASLYKTDKNVSSAEIWNNKSEENKT
jgi:hypothetical protein